MGIWTITGLVASIAVSIVGRSTIDHMPSSQQILPPYTFVDSLEITQVEKLQAWLETQSISTTSDVNKIWYARYRLAQFQSESQPQQACKNWVQLAKDPLFPLAELSFLHAHSVCDPFSTEIHWLANLGSTDVQPWLKKNKLNILLKNSILRQDDFDVMRFAHKKSKLALPPKKKVQLTRLALEKAKLLSNTEMVESLTARLYKLAPRHDPNPPKKHFLRIANDYRRSRIFDLAFAYYEKIVSHKKIGIDIKIKALHGIAKTHKLMRDDEAYIEAMKRYTSFIETKWKRNKKNQWLTRIFHNSQIKFARALWTVEKIKDAKAVLRHIEKNLKKRFTMAKVYWLRGRMQEERGRFEAAIYWFKKALSEKNISDHFKEDIQWLLAWNLYKTNRYDQVIDLGEELVKLTKNDFKRARYRYWLAKSYENSDQLEEAHDHYKTLLQEDPMGYYGLLARRDSAQPIQISQKRELASLDFPNEKPHKFLNRAYMEWLVAVGENEVAGKYLNQVATELRKSDAGTEMAWLEMFSYYAKNGEYLKLFAQLGKMEGEAKNRFLSQYPELVFPRPYKHLVRKASERFNVPKELIYAVMRQESAFNPKARSHADAFGLMQLLPKVGKKMSEQHALGMKKTSDLYKPEINIPLGASFLKRLLLRNESQFIPSVAAYNASEKAISNWMQTRYRGDAVAFIEDIPYEETRSYVRLVMRNMIFYQAMNGPTNSINFPDWPLQLKVAQITESK